MFNFLKNLFSRNTTKYLLLNGNICILNLENWHRVSPIVETEKNKVWTYFVWVGSISSPLSFNSKLKAEIAFYKTMYVCTGAKEFKKEFVRLLKEQQKQIAAKATKEIKSPMQEVK